MSWYPRKNVLVPIDFSEDSFRAVDVALQLVESPESLLVLHVLLELSPLEPSELWHVMNEDARRRHMVDSLSERLSDARYQGLHTEIRFGDPGHEIADCARHRQSDLIVISSHGHRGLKHLLIGSVAERVVRLAHCPVLVLRD